MSRKFGIWVSLIGVVLLLAPVPGRAVIEIQADAVTRVHALSGSETGGSVQPDPTVGHPLANLRADATFDRGIKAYGELYLGKKSPDDDTVEMGSFYGSTGSYFSPVEVRFGRFEMPFGTQGEYRSDHAQVQENALIGNPLVDPTDHQLGGEVSGDHDRFDWAFALTNGTDGSTLSADRGFGSALRVSYELLPDEILEVSLSGYRSYHGDTPANRASDSLTTDNLFGPDEKTNPNTLATMQPEVSTPLPHTEAGLGLQPEVLTVGRNLNAWQADLKLEAAGLWRMRYGRLEDDLSNLNLGGSNETVEYDYWSLEGKYDLPGMGYLAGRWDRLDAKTLKETVRLNRGIDENGRMERYEIGWGRQLSNNLRVKLAYVNGRENLTDEDFEYDGVSFEVSLTGYPRISPKNVNLSGENVSGD